MTRIIAGGWLAIALLAGALLATGRAGELSLSALDAAATFPPGPERAVLQRARKLLDATPALLPANVGGGLSCSSCHIAAGTSKTAFAFLGTYATYPQYNA